MRKSKLILGCVGVIGLALVACSSEEDSQSAQDSLTLNQVYVDHSGKILSQNVYELSKVGKVVAFRQLDGRGNLVRAASDAEIQSATITVDGSCAGSDLMAFDQTGFAGNELCVYVSGGTTGEQACLNLEFTLREQQGCCHWLNWSDAVRSFKSNSQHGYFYSTTTSPCDTSNLACEESFTTSESESPVSTCSQGSTSLNLVD